MTMMKIKIRKKRKAVIGVHVVILSLDISRIFVGYIEVETVFFLFSNSNCVYLAFYREEIRKIKLYNHIAIAYQKIRCTFSD